MKNSANVAMLIEFEKLKENQVFATGCSHLIINLVKIFFVALGEIGITGSSNFLHSNSDRTTIPAQHFVFGFDIGRR